MKDPLPQHRNSLGYVITNRAPVSDDRAMIVWGRRADGERVFIEDAVRGGAEGLRCACGSLLIARKGEIRAHHFAHEARSAAICRTSQLAALVEFSTMVLDGAKWVQLPPYEGRVGRAAVGAVKAQILADDA